MPAPSWISDRLLYAQIATLTRAQDAGRRLRRLREDERGQTPTEYLMIVGLMAAVIVTVFVTFYWAQVRGAASDWVAKVKEAVLGTKMK